VFRRLSSAQKSTEGLGLGLAIVERACARLGHRLDLWSKPGVGSCFMVNVPIVGQTSEPAPSSEPQPTKGSSLGGIVVLVVDRDLQARRALTVMLESWGVHVIEANTALDALNLLDDVALTPDVLLLDHPFDEDRDQGETQRRLGALPCAVLTSDRSSDILHICAKHQITVLQKPLDRRKLREFLETATAQ
jgi:CheY-like chemotaxis protein